MLGSSDLHRVIHTSPSKRCSCRIANKPPSLTRNDELGPDVKPHVSGDGTVGASSPEARRPTHASMVENIVAQLLQILDETLAVVSVKYVPASVGGAAIAAATC